MNDKLLVTLIVVGGIALIAFTVWWELSLWSECRNTNSFWYCVRILTK